MPTTEIQREINLENWRALKARAQALLKDFDEGKHPRDERGRFSESGGGGDSGGDHPGEGYSKDAWEDNKGVIHTTSVYDAARALSENRKVELNQPKQISTLIRHLGQVAKNMEKMGEKAPAFNLCNVSVKGTNLFCAESKGIPRVEMPVIPAKRTKDFIKHLKSLGYDVDKGREKAANLRATQSEISGVKVAQQMARIEQDGFYKRLVVSRDDYILDGHHTWAGQLGLDAKDNNLDDDREVKVARVDISITKLLEVAEAWIKKEGIAKKPVEDKRAKEILARAQEILRGQFIQDPVTGQMQGSLPGAGHGEGGGEGGTSTAKEGAAGGKKPAQIADFAKDNVRIDSDTVQNPEKQKQFLDSWNKFVNDAPADFRDKFLGGIPASMNIRYDEYNDEVDIGGDLKDANGAVIGNYQRRIDFDDRKAESAYFRLNSAQQGKDVGKQLLAANVAYYQKMGLDRVEVHADIDVGGYAWAKYGYVPTAVSWRGLRDELGDKLDRMTGQAIRERGTDTIEAEEWSMIGDFEQEQIAREFYRKTEDEFAQSEIENWRDSGQALEETKKDLADSFSGSTSDTWAKHAIDGYRKERADNGKSDIPYSDEQLLAAFSVEYSSRHDDGRGDLDVTFADALLQEPQGIDTTTPTLPGIPEVKPEEHLTEEMRDGLTDAIQKGFDREAEDRAGDVEPPRYILDNAREFQKEYWDQLSDRDKFKWAQDNASSDLLQVEIDSEDTDQEPVTAVEGGDPAIAAVRTLINSSDPKSIWAIADSKYGKDLLLKTDWNGELKLKDKESMDRFYAYVGKAKKAA